MQTPAHETCADRIRAAADEFGRLAKRQPNAALSVFVSDTPEPIRCLARRAKLVDLPHHRAIVNASDSWFVSARDFSDPAWKLFRETDRLISGLGSKWFPLEPKKPGENEACEQTRSCANCVAGCVAKKKLRWMYGAARPEMTLRMLGLARRQDGFGGYFSGNYHSSWEPVLGPGEDWLAPFVPMRWRCEEAFSELSNFLNLCETCPPSYKPDRWTGRDFTNAGRVFPTKPVLAIDQENLEFQDRLEFDAGRLFVSQLRAHRVFAATGIACGDLAGLQRVMTRYGGFSSEYIANADWSPADVFPVIEERVAASIDATRDPEEVLYEKWAEWMLPAPVAEAKRPEPTKPQAVQAVGETLFTLSDMRDCLERSRGGDPPDVKTLRRYLTDAGAKPSTTDRPAKYRRCVAEPIMKGKGLYWKQSEMPAN